MSATVASAPSAGRLPAALSRFLLVALLAFVTGCTTQIARGPSTWPPVTGAPSGGSYVQLTYQNCSPGEIQQVAGAMQVAHSAIGSAVSLLQTPAQAKEVDGALQTWFGARGGSGRPLAIYRALHARLQPGQPPIDIICDQYQDLYGWTMPEAKWGGQIGFGRGFFQARRDQGWDTQVGTIVHELSHLVPSVGTNDFVYGVDNARSLAWSRPDQALNNADNVEYFIEELMNARIL